MSVVRSPSVIVNLIEEPTPPPPPPNGEPVSCPIWMIRTYEIAVKWGLVNLIKKIEEMAEQKGCLLVEE